MNSTRRHGSGCRPSSIGRVKVTSSLSSAYSLDDTCSWETMDAPKSETGERETEFRTSCPTHTRLREKGVAPKSETTKGEAGFRMCCLTHTHPPARTHEPAASDSPVYPPRSSSAAATQTKRTSSLGLTPKKTIWSLHVDQEKQAQSEGNLLPSFRRAVYLVEALCFLGGRR